MDRYVGLDAHAQSCTLAVMGPTGRRLTSRVVETNGQVLKQAIREIPGRVHLCLEEGTQSSWLYEILEPEVSEIVVTVPEKSTGSKDDLRDAWARAEDLRTGRLGTRVYKAPKHLTSLRSSGVAYRMATQDVVRVKNRLKAVFRARGILVESEVYAARTRSKGMKQLPVGHRELADWLARELDTLVPLREEAEERLLKEAKAQPITWKLATAPGMGPLRTAQLVAIVATPHRFRTSRQFWSYCGLSIVTRSSSDWVQTKDKRWAKAEVLQTRPESQAAAGAKGDLQGSSDDGDHAARGPSAARGLPAAVAERDEAEPGQAHPGTADCGDRAVDVEARGGVRPGAREGRDHRS